MGYTYEDPFADSGSSPPVDQESDEDSKCGTCGDYAEDGYLCDQCRTLEEDQAQCEYHCKGKIHHATVESAAEHVASLVTDGYPNAHSYECDHDCQTWDENENPYGRHWHVASSPIPRKWREWVEA